MDTWRLRAYRVVPIAFAVLLAAVLGACSGHSTSALLTASPDATSAGESPAVADLAASTAPDKITADWLRGKPGKQFGDFSFHLLNAANRPVGDWRGLDIKGDTSGDSGTGGSASFELMADSGAPDDIYLYAVYDGGRYAFAQAEAESGANGEYVFLAVPRRIEDVVAIGLARIGPRRGGGDVTGPLARICFSAGPEQPRRTVSAVNDDPHSSAVFTASGGGDYLVADVAWEERNIGDYNNNGLVEVADLTPVGIYFNQEVATADDPELVAIVDGNLDGFVTVNDITPIGQNFGSRVDGFRLYAAFKANPQPQDFALYPLPDYATYPRSAVYDAADDLAKKKRLNYSAQEVPIDNPGGSWEDGKISMQVRAYADDGGNVTEGPPSNTVELTYGGLPGPPDWLDPVNAAGITDAWGDMQNGDAGVWVQFGGAYDVDGDDVYYRIYYTEADELLFGPQGAMVEVPESELGAGPPYRYFISTIERNDAVEDLVRGTEYQFYVTAADGPAPGGLEVQGTDPLTAHPPALGVSPEPWSCYRGDAQRTGCNPNCTLADPVQWDELAPLSGGSPAGFTQTVISDEGWALASAADGSPQRVDLTDGSTVPRGSLNTDQQFYTALSGTRIIVSNGQQLQSMNYDGSDLKTIDISCGAAPLVLGDLVYVVSAGGDAYCFTADRLIEQWRFELELTQPPDAVLAPAADDADLYYAVDQMLFKVDLLSGELAATQTLPYPPAGGSVALDADHGMLYCCVADGSLVLNSVLVRYQTGDLAESHTFLGEAGYVPTAAPCLALGTHPPLVLVATVNSTDDSQSSLNFYDVSNDLLIPGIQVTGYQIKEVTSTDDLGSNHGRIFLATAEGHVLVVGTLVNLRQDFEISGASGAEIALASELGVQPGGGVTLLTTAAPDPPPYNLDGEEGIQSLAVGDGQLTAGWNKNYYDDHGETIHFAVFYSTQTPLEFDEPRTYTNVAHGIPSSSDSFTIPDLDNGTRYWVGVRAYDGVWGIDENMEQNTEVLGGTPPWQREELRLGDKLPDGGIYFMRGLVDPAGEMHLVYNDVNDTHLTHVWGGTGDWSYEDVLYDTDVPASAQGFEPAWDSDNDRLEIGYASMPESTIGLLVDQGGDYFNLTFPDTTPGLNPQVSLAIGAETALPYTQDIFDVTVESHVDYYLKRTIGGVWQGYEPLEETNLSGRDLDAVLDPADDTSPWVAIQRGGESAPNRHTPQEGECMYVRWESGDSQWDYEPVDAGDNAPNSDCGKRVQQVLDSDGHPHLAYLDLNSSPDSPFGQLKYAYYDGSGWQIETVAGFDLEFQNYASLQYTWGELGLGLVDDGEGGQQPVIAMLSRSTGSDPGEPHLAIAEVWVRQPDSDPLWRLEQLTDGEWAFPRDREPCIMLITPDAVWHVFYATTSDQLVLDDADALVHLWRPV